MGSTDVKIISGIIISGISNKGLKGGDPLGERTNQRNTGTFSH